MFTLVKELRGKSIDELGDLLNKRIEDMDGKWNGLRNFRMHGQNRKFVKLLLSRITGFIEYHSGGSGNFTTIFLNHWETRVK